MEVLLNVVSNGIKDTNLKANHNSFSYLPYPAMVVSNGIKDTNLKANHNARRCAKARQSVVSNGIKDTNLKANHNGRFSSIGFFRLFPMVSKILI